MDLQQMIKQAIDKAGEGADLSAIVAEAIENQESGLKAKNAELISEIRDLKTRAASMPQDFDPAEYKKLKAAQEQAELDRLKEERDWDAARKQIETSYGEQLKSKDDRIGYLENALKDQLINNQAGAEITKAGGNAALLMPHVKAHLQMVEENGQFSTVVVDAAGKTRFSVTNPGEPMSVSELLSQFKADSAYTPAFGTPNSGGGAHGAHSGRMTGSRGNGNANPFQRGPHFNRTEQVRLKKQNPDLAAQLEAQANNTQ